MKTLHIINDLSRHGAETALMRMAEQSHRLGDDVAIICLKTEGELAPGLRSQGIPVTAIGVRFGPRLPITLYNLIREIRRQRPTIVQTWLYHSNLIGGIASRIALPRTPVVWGIHHSILHRQSSKRTTQLVSRISAALSTWLPDRIVYCAIRSRETHEACGYDRRRGEVVPNGISTAEFRPDQGARQRIRAEIDIPASARVIGIVARYHPDKDIATFVQAAGLLAARRPDVLFVLAGSGLGPDNADLALMISATGHAQRFRLLGRRQDIPDVLNAFDIASLSSITEALPVALIEAMSVGLPCVATNVGDAAEVIDRTGRIVPAGDPESLANAWNDVLTLDEPMFRALGTAARERVAQHYRLDVTTDRYRAIYSALSRH